MRRFFAVVLAWMVATGAARAQEETAWVQIEARRTLTEAQSQVRGYAGRLEDVVGHALSSGWYGIALGPYSAEDAGVVLRSLRASGAIPQDSFIVDGGNFGAQFWPVGTGAATTPQALPEAVAAGTAPETAPETAPDLSQAEPAPETIAAAEPEPEPEPDETPREAQASEAALSRGEKEQLQIALQWAGFYNSTIDGLFGRGTRGAMAAWQEANGYDPTGVLTTRQRAALIADYNSVLDGLDLQRVRDDATGIEMVLPTGVVAFAAYDPPFARFNPRGDLPAQVLLISQEGTRERMFGLYEILQTLEIVPPEGPRERRDTGFTLEGIDDRTHSFTEVRLIDGQIKGFTLVWPAGDEERRTRLLAEMRASFTPVAGVLDPALARPGEDQAVDLVSGLAVRKPILTRSGFFIDGRGTVVTTADVTTGCGSLTIDGGTEARVAYRDADRGLAVLTPEAPLSPRAVAAFQTGVPRIQSEVAVAGFPFGGVLAAPAVTFGRIADIRGLNGEEEVKRLALTATDGDAGGPVMDNGGAVLGMLLPRTQDDGRILPNDVGFSLDAEAVLGALSEAGFVAQRTDSIAAITPELLARRAAEVTVLVSCWE